MTKVCILAPIHPYDDVRILQKEANTLVDNGYEVVLVAKCDRDIKFNKITIKKAPVYKNRLERLLKQPATFLKVLRINADIYHIHNPDTILIGFILRTLGKKVIYDTHEDFSKRILMREWIPIVLRKLTAFLINTLEKIASKYFNAIIVTQPQMLKRFGAKSILIENSPVLQSELTEKAIILSKGLIIDNTIIRLIYVGGISKVRGIKETIKVLEILNNTHSFRLWLIGPCSEDNFIEELKGMPGWKYVDYLGYLPQEKAFAYMIQSDIGLVTILDIADHSTTSPNKLFEYQRFGLPFLASNFSRWIEQVSETNSGLFVDPNDIELITISLIKLGENPQLRKEMGIRGRQYIFQEFNWDIESQKLLDLYKSIK